MQTQEIIQRSEDFQRSLFKIQGNKFQLLPYIESALLEIDPEQKKTWVEPFMGSGVVGFNLAQENAFFYDINPHTINFFNDIKNKKITHDFFVNELSKHIKLYNKHGAEHYYRIREIHRQNKQQDNMLFYIINRSCYNGMMRFSKNGFNVPYGKDDKKINPKLITELSRLFILISEKIINNNWHFEALDFKAALEKHKDDKGAIRFCDPPYLGRETQYLNKWTYDDEQALNNLLKDTPFILTTWHSEYEISKQISAGGNTIYPEGLNPKEKIAEPTNPIYKEFWSNFKFLSRAHRYTVGGGQKRVGIFEAIVYNE